MSISVGLDDYLVHGIHGFYDEEHTKPQPFNISVRVDLSGRIVDGQLGTTVDYAQLQEVIDNVGGYYIIVKLDDGLKAGIDVFKINSIKYKISQNLKNSFDPKRILNPGKMYSGI